MGTETAGGSSRDVGNDGLRRRGGDAAKGGHRQTTGTARSDDEFLLLAATSPVIDFCWLALSTPVCCLKRTNTLLARRWMQFPGVPAVPSDTDRSAYHAEHGIALARRQTGWNKIGEDETMQIRPGDLLIESVPAGTIPAGAKAKADNVLRYGESTGHAHRIVGDAVLYENADGTLFIRVGTGGAQHVHEDHGVVPLLPGEHYVSGQENYDPYAKAMRRVLD